MNRFYLLILVFLLFSGASFGQESLEQAHEAYLNRDFQTMITLYEDAIASGYSSGSLYFNLGNAYYESGNIGRALLNYLRAKSFIPRDPDLQINISRIYSNHPQGVREDANWLNRIVDVTLDSLTFYEFAIVTLILWTTFFALLSLGVIVARSHHVLFRILLSSIGMILFWVLLLLGARMYVETQRPLAVIVTDSATVMSGPGESYQAIYTLHAASELRIIEENNGWLRFVLPDERQGWIQPDNLSFVGQNIVGKR